MKFSTPRRLTRICALLIMVFAILRCADDDTPSVDSAPVVQLANPIIESFPNTKFTISATVTDAAGLKSVQMKNEKWLLNKTIDLEGNPKEYSLNYKFTVPANEPLNSEHTIVLSAMNIGGKVTELSVPVKLTLDVTAPTIEVSKPSDDGSYIINAEEGVAEFKIALSVADDKGLATLKVKSAALDLDETVSLSGTSSPYTTDIDFNTPGSYEITFEATDATGNKVTASRKIKLIEALQFDKMFLTDVFTVNELTSDLFGVPIKMTGSSVPAETGYVFTTRYYAAAAGTEIKFIPQQTAFDPFVFGANPDVENGLLLGTDAESIVLPAAGYYEIKVDLQKMEYSATAYTPSDPLQSTMYMAGRGYDGQNWDPSVATALTKNPSNPYEFSLETTLYFDNGGSAGTVQWIFISSQSWNLPYWRFDSAVPTKVIPSIGSDGGGTNVNITVPVPTAYKITFDYHLNSIKAVKK
jgi:hypothetical protein